MKFSSFLTSSLVGLAFAAGLLTLGAGAMAQNAPAAPAAGPTAPPQPTDVTGIGDWTVRCFPVASPNPCEMYEEIDAKASRQRLLGVTIAYVPSADKHLLLIAVPLGVSIPKGVVIQTDTFTSPVLAYRSCDQRGCYVERVIDNASVDSIGKSGAVAAIKVVADGGKVFPMQMSLNGFAAAHDKMQALARQKAKAPAQQIDASAPAKP